MNISICLGLYFFFTGSLCLSSTGFDILSSYNLITLDSLSITTRVQNRTIICESITSSNAMTFASQIDSNLYPSTINTVELNGSIGSGNTIQVASGSFAMSTSILHSYSMSDHVTYTLDSRSVSLQQGNQGSTININPNLTSTCTRIQNDLRALSNQLTLLSDTPGNNATIPISQAASLYFYVNVIDSNGRAVSNLDGNSVLSNSLVQQIEIIVASSISTLVRLVLINLFGTSVTFSQGNFAGTWLSTPTTGGSHTIWNFPQATTLTFTRSWMGTLLALRASLTTNGYLAGTIAVNSLNTYGDILNPPLANDVCV